MADKKRTLVVISHTHWDREWYLPFEAFRARLVHMLEKLLDLLDRDPEYKHFVLDGQTIMVEDYLEIRPGRRSDVERHVRSGRLLMGPNYVLPDEFLIGGESWVRNFQIGIRQAKQFGAVMMVGYSPDAFGHIAHLPAILRGFGIDSVVLWRGVPGQATGSEFLWQAPDGSRVLVLHLPFGYTIGGHLPADPTGLGNRLFNLRQMLEPLAATRYLLIPNGDDHAEPQEELPQILHAANEMLDDAQVVHGHYPMLAAAIRRELGEGASPSSGQGLERLPVLEGEFRSGQRSSVLAGVLSTRMGLKQRYHTGEDLLARWAEPFSAWAHLLRRRNDPASKDIAEASLLGQAWKLLLQNAPHDSICGCSIDPVHAEMAARFDKSEQIGESVLQESLRYIAELAAAPAAMQVVAFNSESGPRTDFCTVRLPADDHGRLPERLVDENNRQVALQILQRGLRSPLDGRERVEVGFVAPQVPGWGYKALRVEYGEPRHQPGDRGQEIENEFFRVAADAADGTLIVEDKRLGVTLRGLNRFVDGGDRGDEYNYCRPRHDEIIDRPARPPQIEVKERGPARHTLEIRLDYALPQRLVEERDHRSSEKVECPIVSRVRLYPGVPRIDIETTVDNRAADHRLRAHFPSSLETDYSYAEQHFGVLRRPIALPEDDGTWMEAPAGTYAQKSFVDVHDGRRGLMLANRGLPEYEVLPGEDDAQTDARLGVTIALTLLRCVGWLWRGDIGVRRGLGAGPALEAPGAQCPGRHTFHYSLIPHEGGWENAFAEAHRFARPLRAVPVNGGRGLLPPRGSLASIEPPALVLSSLKLAEESGLPGQGRLPDGIVLRLYNISSETLEGQLRLEAPFTAVERVNLNEEPIGEARVEAGWIKLSIRPNEIVSLKFKPR